MKASDCMTSPPALWRQGKRTNRPRNKRTLEISKASTIPSQSYNGNRGTSSSFSEESWPCFNAQDSSSCVTLPGRLAEHVEESIHELVDLERCPEAEHLSASGHSGVREGHHEPHV